MKFSTRPGRKLTQIQLTYRPSDLEPVLSRTNIDYHYGHLYRGYVDRFNSGEGDRRFNEAGAFLHAIYFAQFCDPAANKTQPGPVFMDLIRKYKRLSVLRDEMLETAMKIEGSGWIYLDSKGAIRTIKNHEIRDDIVLLIDWWEHAWNPDYLWRKEEYFKKIWDLFDWDHIDTRLATL
jgi:Fe-Mn family superoxide dismutase